jgi:LDH2 family malate/lactate/ureidoglycolate dehydrogenase
MALAGASPRPINQTRLEWVMLTFNAEQLRRVSRAAFVATGAPEDIAARVADALVDANLTGHDSHGVIRIPQYVNGIAAGEIDVQARPEVLRETAVSALVDGRWTFGQVAAERATQVAVAKAREAGMATVGLIRAHHIGRLGEYSEMASAQGVILMVFAGGFEGGHGAAPFGGKQIAFGTNPLSFGLPAGERPDVMVDFATTAVAAGKIRVAMAKGEQLPEGMIADKEGRPTTNPADYFDGGFLLPAGGHKGYGLGVVIELLGQALTGADTTAEANLGGPFYRRSGSLFVALNTGLFRPQEEYSLAADRVVERIKAIAPAPGFQEVLLPGEPELRARWRRVNEGIGVAEATWEAIKACTAPLGVDVDAIVQG